MNIEGGDFDYYETNRYKNPRNKKLSLFLDIGNDNLSGGRETPFNITLTEPLLIDKQSEIYIDNFITFNSMMADISERSCFVLKINEFNINSGVAVSDENKKSRNYYNSLIIPNENRNVANFYSTVSHKAKKYNYVCDINPTKLYNISGYLTDLSGNPIFNGNIYKDPISNDIYSYTYATIGVTKWTYKDGKHQDDMKLSVYTNERATLYAVNTGVADADTIIDVNDLNNQNVTSFEIIFLSNAEKDSNIYFASTKALRDIRRDYTKCIITLKNDNGQEIHYELTDGYIVDNRAIDPNNDNTPPEEGYSSANKGRAIIEFAVISK